MAFSKSADDWKYRVIVHSFYSENCQTCKFTGNFLKTLVLVASFVCLHDAMMQNDCSCFWLLNIVLVLIDFYSLEFYKITTLCEILIMCQNHRTGSL